METNLALAKAALKDHIDGGMVMWSKDDRNGNHVVEFGYARYSWNGLDEARFVEAELRPIVENCELVRYEVVEVEEL